MASELSADVARLGASLLDRVDTIADAMVDRIRTEVTEFDE